MIPAFLPLLHKLSQLDFHPLLICLLHMVPGICNRKGDLSSSRGSSWPRDGTRVSYVSCIGRRALYHWHHLGSPINMLAISLSFPTSPLVGAIGAKILMPFPSPRQPEQLSENPVSTQLRLQLGVWGRSNRGHYLGWRREAEKAWGMRPGGPLGPRRCGLVQRPEQGESAAWASPEGARLLCEVQMGEPARGWPPLRNQGATAQLGAPCTQESLLLQVEGSYLTLRRWEENPGDAWSWISHWTGRGRRR